MLLTKSDLAQQCKVSYATINNWIKNGVISYLKIGKRVLFDKEAVMEDLRKYSTREQPQKVEE